MRLETRMRKADSEQWSEWQPVSEEAHPDVARQFRMMSVDSRLHFTDAAQLVELHPEIDADEGDEIEVRQAE